MRSIALMMTVVGLVMVFALALTDVYVKYVRNRKCRCTLCKSGRYDY